MKMVNRFVESMCELRTTHFRGDISKAGNKKINANFLFGPLLLRMRVCTLTDSCASYQQ
jgi:hypothetical protein